MTAQRRLAALAFLLTATAGTGAWLQAAPPDDPLGVQTGGATTVEATGKNAFSFPFVNLSDE